MSRSKTILVLSSIRNSSYVFFFSGSNIWL